MSPRLPYAAAQLQREITGIDEDATFEAGDLDGLGVYRSLTVFSGNLTRLEETLVLVARYDRRILEVVDHDDYLTVRFPLDQIVWAASAFNLADMYEISGEPTKPAAPIKKTAAKKTAKKSAPQSPDGE